MDGNSIRRGLKDALADVLADPSRDSFRELLRQHTGEGENLDFKADWPADEKLARHMLALGNSGGGCIVVGVSEVGDGSLTPIGLSELKDKADVTRKVAPLIPTSLLEAVNIDDFTYETSDYGALNGKMFQLVSVLPRADDLPFVAMRANADARGAAIYVRRGTESVEANHDELQRILNTRIDTGRSSTAALDLREHLDQLQILEERIPRRLPTMNFVEMLQSIGRLYGSAGLLGSGSSEPNPDFPEEDVKAFTKRVFEAKKRRIERELDVD